MPLPWILGSLAVTSIGVIIATIVEEQEKENARQEAMARAVAREKKQQQQREYELKIAKNRVCSFLRKYYPDNYKMLSAQVNHQGTIISVQSEFKKIITSQSSCEVNKVELEIGGSKAQIRMLDSAIAELNQLRESQK